MIDLSLDVDDLHDAAEPVPVRARPDRAAPDGLLAVAVEVESGEERARRLLVPGDDGWYEGELGPLPEGAYCVTAFGGETVEPVTELLTVLAD